MGNPEKGNEGLYKNQANSSCSIYCCIINKIQSHFLDSRVQQKMALPFQESQLHLNASLPAVEFSQQAVVKQRPADLYEAIVVTPELVVWATAVLPKAQDRFISARTSEKLFQRKGRHDNLLHAGGGSANSIPADLLGRVVDLLHLLASGCNASICTGWIDRREWNSIVEVCTSN